MEIILGLIILALLGYIVFKDHVFAKERRELLNAVLSKTSIEFATANKIMEPEEKKEVEQPEFVPQETVSDEDFAKQINDSLETPSIDEDSVKQ